MKSKKSFTFLRNITLVIAVTLLMTAGSGQCADVSEHTFSFDDLKAGTLPRGWKADATNSKGTLATWMIIPDQYAPSKPNLLSITSINDTSDGVFNLFWSSAIPFKNGIIEAKIRANTGNEDQGGGLIWRVKDANNYYIARYNPLESNFRLYCVKDGSRKTLADAKNIDIKTGQWFALKIAHRDDKIEGWLNGEKRFEVTDVTFRDGGGIGFWTKADAASSFDDLKVQTDSQR